MCGIVGYKLYNTDRAHDAFKVFERLMIEAQVRGKHASGVSWVEGPTWQQGEVKTFKAPICAEALLETAGWTDLSCKIPKTMIGHCRYSTSGDWHDNNNTQPLSTPQLAIVHNGLVSMATKEEFEADYKIDTETANDSEIFLRHALKGTIAEAFRKVYEVAPPIFACGFLDYLGSIYLMRDHLRPLWMFDCPELSMQGFASTQDIIMRAFEFEGHKCTVQECEPYTIYTFSGTGKSVSSQRYKTYYAPEKRFERPPIANVMMSKHSVPFDSKHVILDLPIWTGGDHRKALRDSFKRYCVSSVASWEIDPNYALLNYVFRRWEMSKSQEYWICYLYGVFYHPGSVFYVMQEFPEFEKIDIGRLRRWHTENWKKLRYNTDRKYLKGHFVEMFEDYVKQMGKQTSTAQEEFFAKHLTSTNKIENFHNVTKALNQFMRFGRYSVYIYTECLARCMGMPLQADTVFLKEADSPRAGLCIVLGKADWAFEKLNKEQWAWLEKELEILIKEIQVEYPLLGMDHWFMESCLCAYKGYFRTTKGRYLPYYLDRMADEIQQMQDQQDITSGIDWNVLWQFRKENLIHEYLGELVDPPRVRVTRSMEHVLRDEGRMIGLWPMINRGLLPNAPIGVSK
jgi:hypothetical protein